MLVGLIPAAGAGSRMGGAQPKQYQVLGDLPVLCHALEAFATVSGIDATYLVLAPDDARFAELPLTAGARRVTRALYVGGASRHESVLNGLEAMTPHLKASDWVLVHDAARPGLTAAMILELVRTLEDDPVGGLLALPVADTLKVERLEEGVARVARTIERVGLWQAQTPQMFRYGVLKEALSEARRQASPVTDESSAIERLGLSPRLVRGNIGNFKLTYPEDLVLAERLLGQT